MTNLSLWKTISLFLFFTILTSCQSEEPFLEREIPHLALKEGRFSDCDASFDQHLIITNPTQWNSLLARLEAAAPYHNWDDIEIDFQYNYLIALFDSCIPAGTQVMISRVLEKEAEIIIELERETRIAPRINVLHFQISKINKTEKLIQIID